jgi:sugar O-acyltransferase (sialic acid O-acetyltransferase NeuD family)
MASGLGIYGAGGAGREIAWLARVCLGPNVHIRFIVDNPATQASTINGLDVVTFDQFLASTPNVPVTIAIGDAASRERISETCKAAGLRFQTLIHPGVILSPFVSVGEGSIICEGCVLTTNIEIGRHVYVNIGCTISHDCILDDFATLSPGVHLAGWVSAGRRAFFGTGASAMNGSRSRRLAVGDNAIVGAGACVIDDVAPGETVIGVPARPRAPRFSSDRHD